MASPSINNTCLGAPTGEDNLSVYCLPHQHQPDDDDLIFYFYLYKVTTPVLFALIMLTGLVGNSLVVCVTLTQRRMRTTVNLFLLNLAFSDLTFLVVCVPFMVYHYYAENWLIGEAICKLYQYILYVTVYVTVYTLVSISVMRFLHVVRANRDVCTRRFVIGVVVAVWITMLTTNIPILFIATVKTFSADYADAYHYCAMQNSAVNGRRVFISFFVLTYIAPLSTIATMYVLILRYLHRKQNRSSLRHQQRRKNSKAVTVRRNSYATRISIAIVVVFGACWLPLHALLLNSYYGLQPSSRVYEVYRLLCHVLAYSNSCMNPFIYHYVSTDFRQGLRSLVSSVCRRTGRFGRRARTTTGVLWQQETVLRYSMKEIDTREWTARVISE